MNKHNYVGIQLDYGEMRRILKNTKAAPPWLENDLKNFLILNDFSMVII